MKTLLLSIAVTISATSCGPDSSPEKRMNIKNQELSQKVEVIFKQQQILRDSILILKKEIDSIKYKKHLCSVLRKPEIENIKSYQWAKRNF